MRIRLIEFDEGGYSVQVKGPDGVWDTSRTFTDFREAAYAYDVLRDFHGAVFKVLAEATT